jgi:hypothetical protein
MNIRLTYPDKREVPAAKILGWYHDAVENGEVEGTTDDEHITVEAAALALEDAGLISLAGGQFPVNP